MKFIINQPMEVEIEFIKIEAPVRYGEEDIPNDFPLRVGDMWTAMVDIDTGTIEDWPIGKSGRLQMKVCDEGTYTLIDMGGREVSKIENDYCPNKCIPGECGDYIDLQIDTNGIITNWYRHPNLCQFEKDNE